MRPGYWVGWLSVLTASYGPDRHFRYASLLHPQMTNGDKASLIDAALAISAPEVHRQVMRFVVDNPLQTDTLVA